MTRLLFATAFLLGASAVVWIGFDFAGDHPLAFTITAVIGSVYLIGIVELLQFGRATATLNNALRSIPEQSDNPGEWLEQWLNRLDPSLKPAVKLRIEGERVGLPAPVFSPYLVGLLVMLGLLGTFVGMVDTLNGAVFALRGSTELDAIRAGLAAPIQGLGVAFGTSVAGVAASAMLGLISTLVRRDRMLATRNLESKISTVFREFSLAHSRQQAFSALQSQALALPAVADKLQQVAAQLASMGDQVGDSLLARQNQFHEASEQRYAELARRNDKLGDALLVNQSQFHESAEQRHAQLARQSDKLAATLLANQGQFHESAEQRYAQLAQQSDKLADTLLANQNQFHESTERQFKDLAASVDKSLRQSLATSGAAAGAGMKPVVTAAMAEISQLARDSQRQLADTAGDQLHAFGEEFKTAGTRLIKTFEKTATSWSEQTLALQASIRQSMADSTREFSDQAQAGSASMLAEIGGLLRSTETLVQARIASETAWLDDQGERLEQLTAALTKQLGVLRSQQDQGQAAAIDRLAALESSVATHLAQLGSGLEEPLTRLIETASETPRAAADVIAQLRAEISNNIERDNTLLEERQRVMQDLATLSDSLRQTSTSQREAMEKLVESSANILQEIASRFGGTLREEVAKIADASATVAGGASELSSLGEAFSLAVDIFHASNETMIEHLGRVEESMERAGSRSDEQMAYYVAQAREIIDHSMLSQKEVMEEWGRLARQQRQLTTEAS